jgi:hypothetical protein
VGITHEFVPIVTVLKDDKPQCYRLPSDYADWATTVVEIADMGENYFPTDVRFVEKDLHYYVDIL